MFLKRARSFITGATSQSSPQSENSPGANVFPERLRLILGVGRSGTTWVSRVISRSAEELRFFSEPLFHLKPSLGFHRTGDPTAIDYPVTPASSQALLNAYSSLTRDRISGPETKFLEQDHPQWTACVVKEVHALLGSEAILSAWKIPILFVLRDPVYVIDSLFGAQGLQTIYLDHEVKSVQSPQFLENFSRNPSDVGRLFSDAAGWEQRKRFIVEKTLCAHLIQKMFLALANRFSSAAALHYEDFCQDPEKMFEKAASHLLITWNDRARNFLAQTQNEGGEGSDPYSIQRNTSEQRTRPLKFLTPKEAEMCRSIIASV